MLSKLDEFFGEIEPEVEAISGEESDTQAFMKLMSVFNRVSHECKLQLLKVASRLINFYNKFV